MQAFRLTAPQTTQLCTVAQPEPGPGEVLVKVGAAGICHSDLHIIDAPDALGLPTPFTLGHEIAGWVEALGTGVSGLERGQPVAVVGFNGCGRCSACLAGLDNACRVVPIGGIGLGADGGMAEYVVAQARQLLPIPDLELSQAAPLTDAGLTPYHAIAQVRQALAPGSTCVVIGVGGLGHMAVQILAVTTATRIVAVDLNADALRFAQEHGAHVTLPSNPDTAKHIRDLVGPMPGGADVVLDFVGAPPTVDLARAVVSTGGHISVVGLGGGALPVGFGTIPFEVTVHLPFWGNKLELAEVMALARAGRIRAQVQEFSLDHVATAYDALRSGQIAGRAVVVPAR